MFSIYKNITFLISLCDGYLVYHSAIIKGSNQEEINQFIAETDCYMVAGWILYRISAEEPSKYKLLPVV